MDCAKCQAGYFCCKLKVRLKPSEIRTIEKKHSDFWELDYQDKPVLRMVNKQCIFLKNNKCIIYEIRPQICRNFPASSCKLVKQKMKRFNNF